MLKILINMYSSRFPRAAKNDYCCCCKSTVENITSVCLGINPRKKVLSKAFNITETQGAVDCEIWIKILKSGLSDFQSNKESENGFCRIFH